VIAPLFEALSGDDDRVVRKAGIHQVGFSTLALVESNQDLFYILQWDSVAERDKRFSAFARAVAPDDGVSTGAVS